MLGKVAIIASCGLSYGCHSERSEESRIHFWPRPRRNRQKCFARLNMRAPVYELFSSRVRPKTSGAGVAGPPISERLRYFSEGTVRQGLRDSEHPGLVDRTFFSGSTNLPCPSGSTLR